jgi:hypothetical protein
MLAHELYAGRLVQVTFSDTHRTETVRVEKMKIKKCTVLREDGRRWDFYPVSINPAPEGAVFDLKVEEASVSLGTVVRFKGTGTPGLFTVIALQSGNTLKCAALFGENGNRYYHNVALTTVEVMDRDAVKAYLAYA